MAGIGTFRVGVSNRPYWLPIGALYHADFVRGRYWNGITQSTFGSMFTFTRASTGNYVDSSGVVQSSAIDTPRYQYTYNPNTVAWDLAGLLIEPAATNLYNRSSTFTNATSWTKTRTVAVADQVNGLDGTLTADFLRDDNSASTTHVCQYIQAHGFAISNYYVMSTFVKADARTQLELLMPSSHFVGTPLTMFNVSNGALISTGGGTYGSEDYGNGWFRIWASALCDSTTLGTSQFRLASGNTASYSGDNASGLYLWNAQMEIGTTPTAPIATAAANVTRDADVCSFTIPSDASSILYTFNDNTTQSVAVSPGSYSIPTNLNKHNIKSLTVYT